MYMNAFVHCYHAMTPVRQIEYIPIEKEKRYKMYPIKYSHDFGVNILLLLCHRFFGYSRVVFSPYSSGLLSVKLLW